MDAGAMAGLVTAIGGALAAIVGALALLLRVASPNSRAVQALRALWSWLEVHDLTAGVPDRLTASVLRLIEDDDDAAS